MTMTYYFEIPRSLPSGNSNVKPDESETDIFMLWNPSFSTLKDSREGILSGTGGKMTSLLSNRIRGFIADPLIDISM